jgi:uncharacterized protein (DUF2147 family)
MRTSPFAVALVFAFVSSAMGQDVTGEWLVREKVAAIKIENCGGQLWGLVSWEKDAGGLDSNNPDPVLRRRPTLGMPVILGMKQTAPNRWEGEIYNSQDGKTYSARIGLAQPDVLRVEGCLLGFLCGGEDWTRFQPRAPASPPGARRQAGGQQRGGLDVCSRVSELTRTPQQRRLK